MIFPIHDDNSDRITTPFVNYILIALNVIVFVFFQGMGSNDKFTYTYSTVPQEIVTGRDVVTDDRVVIEPVTGERFTLPGLQRTPLTVYLTLITSLFMHGGFAHLGGNMLFLWIFGDNLEDRMGHLRYLVFYLICGILASLAHVLTTAILSSGAALSGEYSALLVPSLGASGAISAVLGGYILLFPARRVTVFMLRFLTQVPAWVAIGLWFAFQLINGLGMLGSGSQQGGVAYAAHIGGFIAGLVLITFFTLGRPRRATDLPTH